MMSIDQFPAAAAPGNSEHPLLGKLWAKTAVWFRTCADYYNAAAVYEQLSGLSDAELRRRGLSRETLARDVVNTVARDPH
jgi:hypothetical protein